MNRINPSIKKVKAFAPATCANVAVGFDILGFSFDALGDQVTLTKRDDQQIVIELIDSQNLLPFASDRNTASVVVQQFCQNLDLEFGFSIAIQKGIPLCSGMGGSAASAVAALVACNRFLTQPLTKVELAKYALFGEQVASGEAHADNVVPCLFGGLTLIQSQDLMNIVLLPIPELYCVLLRPHLQIATRDARAVLRKNLSLKSHSQQSANLASFIVSLYENDYQLMQNSLDDLIIEPQRAKLIPEFYKIKEAALQAGALGMSLSGSGPALFALARSQDDAQRISLAMRLTLEKKAIKSDCWISALNQNAAKVVLEEKIL
ncbi:MAG: homoserine kinase [Tatlockia sp.]|nr:homoserine kinase [Tatlockia sp.]